MAWINWAGVSGSGDHMVFGQDDGNPTGNAAQLHHGIRTDGPDANASNIHFGGWGGTQDISDPGAASVPPSTWTHVAWQFDNDADGGALAGEAVVFVNGVEVAREDKNNITDPSLNVLIGSHTRDGSAANPIQSFNGLLDDVRIYDTALSQTEIMTAMNAFNVPEPAAFGLLGPAGLGVMLRRRR